MHEITLQHVNNYKDLRNVFYVHKYNAELNENFANDFLKK